MNHNIIRSFTFKSPIGLNIIIIIYKRVSHIMIYKKFLYRCSYLYLYSTTLYTEQWTYTFNFIYCFIIHYIVIYPSFKVLYSKSKVNQPIFKGQSSQSNFQKKVSIIYLIIEFYFFFYIKKYLTSLIKVHYTIYRKIKLL